VQYQKPENNMYKKTWIYNFLVTAAGRWGARWSEWAQCEEMFWQK